MVALGKGLVAVSRLGGGAGARAQAREVRLQIQVEELQGVQNEVAVAWR